MARPLLPLVAAFLVLVIITTNLSSTANANPGSLLTVYYGRQCFDGPSETYRHCGCHNIEDNYRHHHHHHHHHSVGSYEYEHFHGRPATLFEDRDCGGSRHPLPGQGDRKCSGHFPWKSVMIWHIPARLFPARL
ncbi:hypothetical protein EJ110_NYTH58467 [Nymphaea thermarum]|nr:hypothetical protein EJ110_NYTH58460 [Nymphaea thermarum]KAF3772219.1 hypothetical protein EJ110_NYTH58467 [Nymphaea thermarum]